MIISVDPGHRPGPECSYTVMQAWCSVGDKFFLLDQWRAQCDAEAACRALRMAVVNSRAAAVVIECSGYGPVLERDLRKRFRSLEIKLVFPDGRSKSTRLLRHIELIRSGRILLPHDAVWRGAFVAEMEHFPHGEFDDQVDALTQALDYFLEHPAQGKAQRRCVAMMIDTRGVARFADHGSRWMHPAYERLGRPRRRRIFPEEE